MTDVAAKVTKADYSITVDSGTAEVKRLFHFSDGSAIEFAIKLPTEGNPTLTELHRSSVTQAIALLKTTVPPGA
jgi:hypothetical protein